MKPTKNYVNHRQLKKKLWGEKSKNCTESWKNHESILRNNKMKLMSFREKKKWACRRFRAASTVVNARLGDPRDSPIGFRIGKRACGKSRLKFYRTTRAWGGQQRPRKFKWRAAVRYGRDSRKNNFPLKWKGRPTRALNWSPFWISTPTHPPQRFFRIPIITNGNWVKTKMAKKKGETTKCEFLKCDK